MIYQLFNEFIDTFIIEKRDFLSGNNTIVLTQEALSEIIRVYVENQIEGTDMNFAEKLKTQFEGASENSKIVFAHASWLFVLGSNSMTSQGKINAVQMSLFDIPNYSLRESIFLNKEGISDPGTAYNTSKPLSLKFLINLFNWLLMSNRKTTHQDVVDRIEAICLYGNYRKDSYLKELFDSRTEDDIKTKFAMEVNKGGAPAKIIILNYLLNLCQPDRYERMASFRDKAAIAKKLFQKEYGSKEGINIDDQIRVIKENLAKQNPDIDPTRLLYDPRIKPLWDSTAHASSPIHDARMNEDQIEFSPTQNKPNYWIFQGNPKIFDIVTALRDKAETWWKVARHTNNIKIGDKVILWVTGENSGCYALGEIISEIEYGVRDVEDQAYYRDDSHNQPADRVRISLLYNLVDKPILKDQIMSIKALSGLNVGLQGTNFRATKRQYEVIERLANEQENRDTTIGTDNNNANKPNTIVKNHPLNQILFGPPGTGKTYKSIELAVEIADPGFIQGNRDRAQITQRYKELTEKGRIVFTTFHQSMSYEDFIEGIKPLKPEDDQALKYDVQDGVFKRINTMAMYHLYTIKPRPKDSQSLDMMFEAAYGKLISKITATDNNPPYEFTTKNGSIIQLVDVSDSNNLWVRHKGSERLQPYIVSKGRLLKMYMEYKTIEQIADVSKDIDRIIGAANYSAYYAVLKELFTLGIQNDNSGATELSGLTPDYDTMKIALEKFELGEDWKLSNDVDNYVLIIDEINRGNVSQIFGELITLVEEDKRAGKEEALRVSLPYSGESFCVAPNLYIIGTMNTADRSVEAIDTALRRRFTFEEILPQYEIKVGENYPLDQELCGYKLKDIMKTLNKRIKMLLDRDHQIGHSYFLGLNKENEQDLKEKEQDLMDAFNQKIIPLLQEYFYGDYAKIGLILGKGFVGSDEYKTKDLALFEYDDVESVIRETYRIKEIDKLDDFCKALGLMMGKAENEQQEQV